MTGRAHTASGAGDGRASAPRPTADLPGRRGPRRLPYAIYAASDPETIGAGVASGGGGLLTQGAIHFHDHAGENGSDRPAGLNRRRARGSRPTPATAGRGPVHASGWSSPCRDPMS